MLLSQVLLTTRLPILEDLNNQLLKRSNKTKTNYIKVMTWSWLKISKKVIWMNYWQIALILLYSSLPRTICFKKTRKTLFCNKCMLKRRRLGVFRFKHVKKHFNRLVKGQHFKYQSHFLENDFDDWGKALKNVFNSLRRFQILEDIGYGLRSHKQ